MINNKSSVIIIIQIVSKIKFNYKNEYSEVTIYTCMNGIRCQ